MGGNVAVLGSKSVSLWVVTITLAAVLAVTGCTADRFFVRSPDLPRYDAQKPTIILMPPDVLLFELSAGGFLTPNGSWTETAKEHMGHHLAGMLEGAILSEYREPSPNSRHAAEITQAIAVSILMGTVIKDHHSKPVQRLPNKQGRFDWSLGEEAVAPLRLHTGADHALFLSVHDSYADVSRIVLQVVVGVLFGPSRLLAGMPR
ncbi:MAG: hypothetical protein FD149_2487 [Rhodospirillaceae bacterium]|nr:MAG: hypothetical protein FD149_2487 [Rhodospirillaceae bacterium]